MDIIKFCRIWWIVDVSVVANIRLPSEDPGILHREIMTLWRHVREILCLNFCRLILLQYSLNLSCQAWMLNRWAVFRITCMIVKCRFVTWWKFNEVGPALYHFNDVEYCWILIKYLNITNEYLNINDYFEYSWIFNKFSWICKWCLSQRSRLSRWRILLLSDVIFNWLYRYSKDFARNATRSSWWVIYLNFWGVYLNFWGIYLNLNFCCSSRNVTRWTKTKKPIWFGGIARSGHCTSFQDASKGGN